MKNIIEEKINELIESGDIEQALKLQEQSYIIQQSQYISVLIEQGRLEEALEVCNKFEDYEPIQSQKVTILIKQDKIEEALEVCNRFEEYKPIQSQKITILIRQDKLEKALEICNRFEGYEPIQSQKITILIKQDKLKEASEICNRFENSEQIQSQKITILIKQGKLEEALEICNKFENNEPIQSQKVTILIRQDKLEEALEICNHFKEYKSMQSQKVTILIKQNKLEEALEICNKFENYEKIQSQKITILMKQGKLEKALKVSNKFENDELIQSQKVAILIKKGKLEEAYNICSQKKYENNPYFIKKIQKINQKIQSREKASQNDNLSIHKNFNNENSVLLTKIYCNSVLPHEIEEEKIDEWSKIILTIAYYEKNNRKKGINVIKEFRKKNNITSEQSKILNILFERLNNTKIVIFDPTIYSKYLNCYVDSKLISELSKQQEKQIIKSSTIKTDTISKEKNKINNNLNSEQDKKIVSKKMIAVEGKRIDFRNNSNSSSYTTIQKSKNQSQDCLLIKDLFKEEVLEIGKYLYVQMSDFKIQSIAVAAWDRFEVLINKPVSDQIALERMISFLKRIENSSTVTISLDEKKYTKYLKR